MEIQINIVDIVDAIMDILMRTQLILLVLHFTNLINWPWWQVAMPLFIYWGITFVIGIITIVVNAIFEGDE